MTAGFDRGAYMLFGKWVESRSSEYIELSHKLIEARIGVPFEVYVSRAYLLSIILSLPAGILLYSIFPESLKVIDFSLLIIPLLSFLAGYIVYSLILVYPQTAANLRGQKIDIVLPHAVALMHALSRGSGDITGFFEIINKNKKIYGEVSEEVKFLLIETKVFNHDIKTALKNSAAISPSETFKNFLESLSTCISSGSNVVAFLLSKSEQFRVRAQIENKAFMDNLGLMAEVYVTGFAAGPLFIIVLLVVLGLIGGVNYFLLSIIVYLLIPGGGVLFIILIGTLAEGTSSKFLKIEEDTVSSEEFPLIRKSRIRMQIYEFISHPLKTLIEVPEKILYFSVPLALFFFLASTYNYYSLESEQMIYKIDDYIVFSALIALIPYTIFIEFHFRRINQISKNFPEFLNRLVSLHESGLTISSSLRKLTLSNLGVLDQEIKKMNTDIELSGSIAIAFRNFGSRVKTVSVQRVVILIENAARMTGNIKDTLAIAASDVRNSRSLEEDRIMSTKMHVYILYISFFVFLYVAWSIVTGFLPRLPDMPMDTASELIGEGISFTGIDKELYVRLFFHASIMDGFFSGLVAGQIGEGDARLGLKHGIIMTVIAYVVFLFVG